MPIAAQLLVAILRTDSLLLPQENVGKLRAWPCGVLVQGQETDNVKWSAVWALEVADK